MLNGPSTISPWTTLLAATEMFQGVPSDELAGIADAAIETRFGEDEEIIREGDHGDELFVIVNGRVRVSRRVRVREQVIGEFGPGAVFGEVALLDPSGLRTATVVALEPTVALRVAGSALLEILDAHPDVSERVKAGVRCRLNGDALLQTASLVKLSSDNRARLAAGARRRALGAGDTIVTEGSRDDVCFILAAGAAEVLISARDGVVARLGPGALIGEISLLSDVPHTATVRATTDGELIEIDGAALLEVLRGEADVRAGVARLISSRIAAQQNPDVRAETTDRGDVTVLKDTRRHAYYRLSELGRFVWDRLDGEHSVQELTVAAYRERGSFAPEMIAAIVDGLVRAGFAHAPRLTADVTSAETRGFWTRLLRGALALVTWAWTVDGVDPWLTRVYRRGGRVLFYRPVLIAAGAVLIAGLAALVVDGPSSARPFGRGLGPWIVLALIPAYGLAVALHELGHALTVKRFGREVNRVGIGWYMWAPTVFVDTSDMWLDGRRRRIFVTLAGPLMNALIGASSSLIALALGTGAAAAIAWQFAFANFLIALINFNPMLEVDGYYVLMDALDRPNLRREALTWLGGPMWRDIAAGRGIRGHGLHLAYGLASLAYVVGCGTLAIFWLRSMLDHALAAILSTSAAEGVAWTVSLALLAAVMLATVAQLRGTRLSRSTSG